MTGATPSVPTKNFLDNSHKIHYSSTMINNNLPPEDVEFLRRYEEKLKGNLPLPRKSEVPYRIRLKSTGQFIKLSSGKTIWPRIGAAKSALRNDFPNMLVYGCGRYKHSVSGDIVPTNYGEHRARKERVFEEFINNYVEFVPCPN